MKNKKNIFSSTVSLAVVAMVSCMTLLSSCYTKEDVPYVPVDPPKPAATYNATITVLDENMAPMNGVTFQGANVTGTTSPYALQVTSGGSYNFVAVKSGYLPVTYTVTFPQGVAGDVITAAATIMMQKAAAPAKYVVQGLVIDGTTQETITATTVTYGLRGTATTTTVTTNPFELELSVPGVYDFTVTNENYETVKISQTIQPIAAGETSITGVTVPMYPKGTVGGLTYSISGSIIDLNQQFVPTAKLYVTQNDVTTIYNIVTGTYNIPNLKKGNVTIVVEAEGKLATEITFDLSQFAAGTNIPMNLVVRAIPAGQNNQVVTPGANPEEVIVVPPTVETPEAVKIESEVSVPSNLVVTNTETGKEIKNPIVISTLVNGTIAPATTVGDASAASATFATGTFGPSGVTFATPIVWEVTNPYAVKFEKLGLQFYQNGAWVDQSNQITYANGSYTTGLTHFSQYRMVVKNSALDTLNSTSTVSQYYLTNNATPIVNAKFDYLKKTGTNFIVTPRVALANQGISDEKVVLTLEKAIQGVAGTSVSDYSEVNVAYITGAGLTNQQILTSDVVYSTKKYTYTYVIDSKSVVVIFDVVSSKVNYQVGPRDAHHIGGGHVTDAGAGGGSGN